MSRVRVFVILLGLSLSLALGSCINRETRETKPYKRPLEIVKIADHSYLHISYLETADGNSVACNGYIYAKNGEAFVFDTPINDSISRQLIRYLESDLKLNVKGVVVNHRHLDAAGGLAAFTEAKIPSYASMMTADYLKTDSIIISHPFKDKQELQLGGSPIENYYFGPAHTSDNIVSYIPEENLLYGGCLIKALGADKGNLADADLTQWVPTVNAIKEAFPEVETVIPGHGAVGDVQLLEYTSALFASAEESDD